MSPAVLFAALGAVLVTGGLAARCVDGPAKYRVYGLMVGLCFATPWVLIALAAMGVDLGEAASGAGEPVGDGPGSYGMYTE